MFSKRIKTIASLIDKTAIVLDVGTDHAYLPIYLMQNNIVKKVYGSDISEKVLNGAHDNLKKYNMSTKIKLFLSNGLDNINVDFNCVVITGMGFSTIKNILNNKTLPETIIIQTNSEHDNLRKFMNNLGYSINKEVTFIDKKIYYVIIKYTKGVEKLNLSELTFGKSYNPDYYLFLLNKNKKLLKQVPFKNKLKYIKNIIMLKSLLKKSRV